MHEGKAVNGILIICVRPMAFAMNRELFPGFIHMEIR